MKKIICYVPARLNSTRLPGKNLKELGGKPMMDYIIEALKESSLKNSFWVNTPSLEIITHCKEKNVPVYERNPKLDLPGTTTEDILIDFVKNIENSFDLNEISIILANPTNPLVESDFIDEFVQKFKESEKDVVASVNPIKHHLIREFKVINYEKGCNMGTQHLEPIYEMNWLLLGIKGKHLQEVLNSKKGILEGEINPINTPFPQHLDVDTQEDFDLIKNFIAKD